MCFGETKLESDYITRIGRLLVRHEAGSELGREYRLTDAPGESEIEVEKDFACVDQPILTLAKAP